MFLACTAQSAKHRIYFLAFSSFVSPFTRELSGSAWCIHWTSAFEFSNASCLDSAKIKTQNLLFVFYPSCRCICTRVFLLCDVHTLNKHFRGKVMFLVCTTQSSKRRIYFCGSSTHKRAFAREYSGCASSIIWTSAFLRKFCFFECVAKNFQPQNLLFWPSFIT